MKKRCEGIIERDDEQISFNKIGKFCRFKWAQIIK